MAQQILLRRDTAAQWTAVNPTLAEGEIGVETDTVKLKVGTGAIAWNSLPYVSGGEGAGSHSLLLNLNADDHSHYHTDARGDARYVGLSDPRLTDARTPLAHDQAASTITGLATVATTGAYSDLSGQPSIPTLPAQASEAELLAGTETALRSLSPADLVTAITEHGGSGASGTKTLAVFTPMTSQPPAMAFATLDTRNSIAVLDFDDGSINEATTFVGIIPEGADLSSGITARIFWMATTGVTGACRWGVQFEKYGTDNDVDSFDIAAEAHTTCSEFPGIAVVTEITATSIDSLAAGDQFRLRVYRDSSNTTNDTMAGDAEFIALELRGVA